MRTTEQYVPGQVIAAAFINLVLNGGLAWLIYRGSSEVPLFGEKSIVGDTVVTSFCCRWWSR